MGASFESPKPVDSSETRTDGGCATLFIDGTTCLKPHRRLRVGHPPELPTSALIAAIIKMNWTLALTQASVVDLHRSAQRPFGTVAQAGCLFQNGGLLSSSVCFLCSLAEQKSSESVILRAGRIPR